MAVPPKTPKWIVVSQHNNHFHLWKEIHKDIAHQLNELQQVEARVSGLECRLGGLSLQVEGVEVQVAEQEVVGNRLLRLVLWSMGGVLHLMAKVDFLQHLVTSFLSFGGGGGEGLGSPNGPDEPLSGPGLGLPLPPVPPSSPCVLSNSTPPLSPPPPQYIGLICQGHSQRMRGTGSGQPCRPSRVQRLRMALISNFQELEEVYGELRAWEILREELEMHRISVYHNVLGCQNCDLTQRPTVYCRQSRHHPSHSLHVCPMTQSCPCS